MSPLGRVIGLSIKRQRYCQPVFTLSLSSILKASGLREMKASKDVIGINSANLSPKMISNTPTTDTFGVEIPSKAEQTTATKEKKTKSSSQTPKNY